MKNTKRISTQGKTVFVGIDVHKDSYTIAGVCEGMKVGSCRLPAEFIALIKSFDTLFPGAKICTVYEAGFAGFGLHRFLEKRGIKSIVVNPADIYVQANDRVKTDKRDALTMASQLAGGMLHGIAIPEEALEHKRALTRHRESLVEDRSATITRIKSKLHQFGHMCEAFDGPFGKKRLAEFEQWVTTVADDLRQVFESLIRTLRSFEKEIASIEKAIAHRTQDDTAFQILSTIPGFGPVTSSVVANEIGDFRRFNNRRQIASFCGLTPSENSSGEKIRRGTITKKGSSRLRSVLVEASWRAIKHCDDLAKRFEKLKYRCGARRAIVAIAHALIVQARACVISQRPYTVMSID